VGSTPALFRQFGPNGFSMTAACTTDFDDWLVGTFARVGSFTMLIVLVEIGETTISLFASSYLHIIGDKRRWDNMVDLLTASGARLEWCRVLSGRQRRPDRRRDRRQTVAILTRHQETDRSILKHGELFNARGLRMKIEEIGTN
jgi:hypothetical protein